MVFSIQGGSFDAPIPGQSLTQPVGASPNEHPPQFVNPDEALDFIWDKLHKPKTLSKLVGMLKADIPVEVLARTIIYQGLLKNNWTVDVGLLMLQTVIWQIEAIAKLKKIKVKTFVDDKDHQNSLLSIGNMLNNNSAQNNAMSTIQPEQNSSFKGFF